jgi:hypothetical protein
MHFGRVISVLAGRVYLSSFLASFLFVAHAFAQRQPKLVAPPPRASVQPKQQPAAKQPGLNQGKQKGKMAPLPAPQLQRLMQMTPEQRERALSRLPPEQRQDVENRLNQFERQFQRLPPEQQAALQQRYEAFSKLPQDRRTAIRQELQQLRTMTPAQRADRLNSDDARQSFSPDELSILRGVAGAPEP